MNQALSIHLLPRLLIDSPLSLPTGALGANTLAHVTQAEDAVPSLN